ncbi:MAG: CHASE2 domain-containing protein [Pseudomonadota bacterium]
MTVLLGLVLGVICIATYLMRPALIEYLQYKLTDGILSGAGETGPTNAIVIVDIDEKTLAAQGQWPWPRYLLAKLLNEIARMGAKSIALDFILAEPDRTSLKTLQQALRNEFDVEFDTRLSPNELPDNDAILAATLSGGSYVLGYEFLFSDGMSRQEACQLHRLQLTRIQKPAGNTESLPFFEAQGVVCNLGQFADAVSFSGFLNGQTDSDGRLRRLPLLIRFGDALYPNLALAALLSGSKDRTLTLRRKEGEEAYLVWADNAIPIDAKGNVQIRFPSDRPNVPHVSADLVLKGEAPEAAFKDRIVFVGLSASGLAATYQTPTKGSFSAVAVHAQLAETISARTYSRRPPGVVHSEVVVAMLIALLYSCCVARLEVGSTVLTGAIGILGLWEGANLLYENRELLFSPLLPGGVILVNSFFLLLFNYWIRQRTAQRGMQNALLLMRNSEKELSSILNTIPDIVFRLDAAGKITFISPAVAKYKKQPGELIGKHILELVAPEDRATAIYRVNERRTAKRATHDLEVRLLFSPDCGPESGEERFFSVSAEGIYTMEKPDTRLFLGTQGIARDIEQRKRLEHQLAQSKKMEAMGSLAAGVAHDLNNILGALIGYPELLLLELPADSPMRESLEHIRHSGQRAAAIVQDMLTIARRGVQIRDIVNLNEAITAYMASPEFRKLKNYHPKLQFVIELSNDLMNVKGSAVHLSKVIMNLIGNAAEAMPTGGTIGLMTRNRYLDTELKAYEKIPEGDYVRLSITDEGVGIAQEDLARIFEPFYSKKKMDRSGSGLGMTVVWNTVKDHGGYVNIKSKEGEGTRFDLYFPATREEKKRLDRQLVLEDYIGTESILVVDDIPEQLNIAVRMLGKLGYKVAAASGGEEAVAHLKSHSVDLLVLDMVMPPGIDGLETFERIRAIHPHQKAIIASGFAESDRVNAMQAMGAGVYIRKPYTLEKIGIAVRSELDRK